jgi:hypothetical protein
MTNYRSRWQRFFVHAESGSPFQLIGGDQAVLVSVRAFASEVGVHEYRSAVKSSNDEDRSEHARSRKASGRGHSRISLQQIEEMREMRRRGETIRVIAQACGAGVVMVSKYTLGIEVPRTRHGGRSPVGEDTVASMRQMRLSGSTIHEIAARFSFSPSTIVKYTKGITAKRGKVRGGGHERTDAHVQREHRIIQRLKNGATLRAVARDEDITGEWVRQILVAYERRTGDFIPRGLWKKQKPPKPRKRSPIQKMLERATLHRDTGCWHWIGALFGKDDAVYPIYNGAYVRRASYRLWRGEIPSKHVVVPRCADELCVNPFHLEAVAIGERFRESEHWDQERDTWKHSRNAFGKHDAGAS